MTRKTILILFALGLAFIMGFGLAARMQNPAGSVIPRDVVAGGGGRSTTPSGHVLQSTIGQPAAGISYAGNGTSLVGGFQTMTRLKPSTAARRWNLY